VNYKDSYLDHILFISTNALIDIRIDFALGRKTVPESTAEIESIIENLRDVVEKINN
jgi:hypothetical protein